MVENVRQRNDRIINETRRMEQVLSQLISQLSNVNYAVSTHIKAQQFSLSSGAVTL